MDSNIEDAQVHRRDDWPGSPATLVFGTVSVVFCVGELGFTVEEIFSTVVFVDPDASVGSWRLRFGLLGAGVGVTRLRIGRFDRAAREASR